MDRKIAIVFGGSRGIGAAAVQALAAGGFDVAYTYVSRAPEAVPTVPGARISAHEADVRDADAVAGVFAEVAAAFGRKPDCVVANAGINAPYEPVARFDRDNFRRLVEVNIVGAFNVLQMAAREVADGGSIIALTSSMVRVAIPGGGPYTATKAAVESLVRSMSRELAGRGIRVNAVAPGPVDTDLFRTGKDEAAIARSAAMSPFSRVGRPEEIGAVIRFLASAEASWIHGQVVQPNGGMV